MSEVQETGTKKQSRFRITSIIIAVAITVLMICSSLGTVESAYTSPTNTTQRIIGGSSGHGQTFNLLNITSDSTLQTRIEVIGGVLYAGIADLKFAKSLDDGATWTTIYDFNASMGLSATVWDLFFLYYSTTYHAFFASPYQTTADPTATPLYRSVNYGVTWTLVDTMRRYDMIWVDGMCEAPDGTMYYGTYGDSASASPNTNFCKVSKSTNGGVTWMLETWLWGHHIHALEIGHDGKIWAGMGDPFKVPYWRGCYVKSGGVWANSSSLILQSMQPTAILRTMNATLFGSDGTFGAGVARFDGVNIRSGTFHPTGSVPPGGTNQGLCFSLTEIDGVIYAVLSYSTLTWSLWAGINDGADWYEVANQTNDPTLYIHVSGENGHPYIYLHIGVHILRVANIQVAGITQFICGPRVDNAITTIYTDNIYLANGRYQIPLNRNGVRDPQITIKAMNLTNRQENSNCQYGLDWHFPLGAGLTDIRLDTVNYTRGTQSIQMNASKGSGVYFSTYHIENFNAGEYIYLAFNGKKASYSQDFVVQIVASHISSGYKMDWNGLQLIELTDTWQTYTVMPSKNAPIGTTAVTMWYTPWNTQNDSAINETANFDEFRVFVLPSNIRGSIAINGSYDFNVAVPTRNVTLIAEGAVHTYGAGPWNDGQTIDTINLIGDYFDFIDLSATCNGLLNITVSGQMITHSHNLSPKKTATGFVLMGGDTSSNITVIGSEQIYSGSVVNQINSLGNSLFKTSPGYDYANLTGIQAAIAGVGYLNISSVLWTSGNIGWIADASNPADIVTFILSGLESGTIYKIYVDDVIVATMVAAGGQISFDYSAWSTHTFEVVVPTTYEPPTVTPQTPSERSPATSDPGTTSFSWTSPALIAIVSCSVLVALVLLLRRPKGRSGTRHS